jgi:hypothetical protein
LASDRTAEETSMHPARFLYVPYRISRLPLASLDQRLAHRLGHNSAVRSLTRATLAAVDRVAAVILDERPLRVD